MIINAPNLAAAFTGFKTAFNTGFRSAPAQWSNVASRVPSNTASETYGWLGQFPQLREWVGDKVVKNMSTSSYTITNKDYEATIGVDRNNLEDDQYGFYSPLMQEMGYAAATHPDRLVFDLLAAGFSTTCYDGQFFFDTDHPVGTGTVSNSGGGAGAQWFLLNTSRPLKPFLFQVRKDYALLNMNSTTDEAVFTQKLFRYGVEARVNVGYGFWQQAYGSKQTLDATNFTAAREAMLAFKSDEGRPLGIQPDLLVVGPTLLGEAEALLEAQFLASGASNTSYKKVQLLVCPWLA